MCIRDRFKAAEQRRFQAFIGAETNTSLVQWQNKLPVPVAFLGAPTSVPNNVDMDLRQFVEGSLGELARQGCRSVGLIAPILAAPNPGHPVGGDVRSFGMLEHFTDVADDLGLTVKNDWMRVIKDQPAGVQGDEHFGYEQFLKLWNQPEKPEGLLIFYDTTVSYTHLDVYKRQLLCQHGPGNLFFHFRRSHPESLSACPGRENTQQFFPHPASVEAGPLFP